MSVPKKRQTVCVISFSEIARDARVLRQLEYLAPAFDLIVVGHGPPPARWTDQPGMTWIRVEGRSRGLRRLLRAALLVLGRATSRLYDRWYWLNPVHQLALEEVGSRGRASKIAAVHANDWNALPLAARIADKHAARVVLDLHEYAPLEWEEQLRWRFFFAPAVDALLRQYAPVVAASMTVAPALADKFRAEFDLDPMIVLNTPATVVASAHPVLRDRIRLIHHGVAQRERQLELTIDAVGRSHERYTLDFMLVADPQYIAELQDRAGRMAPGRITFREPVAPPEIVATIAEYDLGVFLLPATSYNKAQSLPNKLFDFVAAGLGVIVGPTPAMADFVRDHGIGLVAPSFDPDAVASALNELDLERIISMRNASTSIAGQFTADREMAKVVRLYRRLLAS